MYRIKQFIYLSTLLTLLATPNIGLAETSDSTVADDNIGRLATAVEDLTRLLANQSKTKNEETELRKLNIAISYLNFRSRRIEMMDRDLSMVRNERDRIGDFLQEGQERKEQLKAELEDKSAEEKKSIEQTIREVERREKLLSQRYARIEEEVIILENQVSDLQNELDDVENYVKQHLQL